MKIAVQSRVQRHRNFYRLPFHLKNKIDVAMFFYCVAWLVLLSPLSLLDSTEPIQANSSIDRHPRRLVSRTLTAEYEEY